MSDSEDNFDLDINSDTDVSDGYAPAAKKNQAPAKAAPKATTSKRPPATKKAAPAKKKATKTVLKEIHNNGSDSESEPDSGRRLTSTGRKGQDDTDEENALPIHNKGKTAHEKYQVLDAIQHILKRPDSYVGSLESIRQSMWVYDSDSKRMVFRDVQYSPAFLKIFDEILVNAADNKINDPSMDTIKVNIDVENGTISVFNNGNGIPIVVHEKEKVYIPQMIFGQLLSSSNYDDTEKKVTGGRNGYGAKLTNIYSTEFTVETADKSTGLIYKQTWSNNMGVCGKPKITKNTRNTEFTRITFRPELHRFHMDSIDNDTVALLMKRVYDMAGSVKDIKVWLNDDRLKIKGFRAYVDLYLSSVAEQAAESGVGSAVSKPTVVYERLNSRWEIAFALSEGTFQQISFANSISTTKGGTHVNMIADQLCKNLIDTINKKNKGAQAKAPQIKNHMWLFVNALVENPTFDSQTKETLTLPASKFGGGKTVVPDDFVKKVVKSGIVENVLNWAKFKADQQAKKTDGTKRTRLSGMDKLSDANNAGGRKSADCTLILTEGDSAKALAVAGLSVVGRDNFGVFPLRGKLLNVRDARHDQIMKNEEIQAIKKIIGLQHNKQYDSTSSLRYGSIMIMTDQDHDGSHIKGLLINFLECFYPSLLKVPNFLVEFVTPIVRIFKKSKATITRDFFTVPQFTEWYQEQARPQEWRIKYYKGLGTSTEADAREYFSHMERHMISFQTSTPGDQAAIELAFSKKKADARKEWLRDFEPGTFLDHNIEEVSIEEFVNKELILFSMADNVRSIPSVADGLKPVQRKVLWTCFKRKLTKEIKVAQLCGAVSEMACYHHGEASLMETIVNLAQDFVGSNNINILKPNGQYGTRETGGKDHASARYIFTELLPITRSVFNVADDPLLDYLVEEGNIIEPQHYMPVVPMLLINGCDGIGTGWSTNIPSYNPEDIVENLKRMMRGEALETMAPWWRGFKGTMAKVDEQRWKATGVVKKLDSTTVEITELPLNRWTQTFKKELEAMIGEKGDGGVKDYKEYHDSLNIHFVITMSEKELEKAESQGLEEYFKLHTKLHTSNMICFDYDGKIKKYETAEQIIEEFYPKRLAYYQKRKDYLANELQTEGYRLSNQARFIQMIVDKKLVVSNRKKADIVSELRKLEFTPFPKEVKVKVSKDQEPVLENFASDEEAEAEQAETGTSSDFDYLLGMPIWSLTKEKIARLLKQIGEKEEQLKVLLARSPLDSWVEDLDRFVEHWRSFNADWLVAKKSEGQTKKKHGVLKTRKSVGKKKKAASDDSEDDFRPVKLQTKLKPQIQSSATNSLLTNPIPAGERAAVDPKRNRVASGTGRLPKKSESSDSEAEVIPVGNKGKEPARKRKLPDIDDSDAQEQNPKKTKAIKKVKTADGSLDSFLRDKVEEPIPNPPKTKVKKMNPKSPPKASQPSTAKKAKIVNISDDEEPAAGSSEVEVVQTKRIARARAPTKYVDISTDGDEDNDDDDFTMND